MVFLGDHWCFLQADSAIVSGARGNQLVQPADASGRGGHPVLIPNVFFQKLLSSYEGEGLRGLFRSMPPPC